MTAPCKYSGAGWAAAVPFAVDRGVNPKVFGHGAVPAIRVDHLLADIINRVVLALRVLPISDYQILGLCRGAIGTVDQTEVAHASEGIISCVARGRLIGPGRESIRALDHAREGGAFAQRELVR